MAEIKRSSVIQRAVNDLNLSPAIEKIPSETLDKIQLTYDLGNKEINTYRASTTSSTASSTAVYTVGANEDFYLWGAFLSNMSDVTADNTTIRMTVTINGVARDIIRFMKFTTTAYNNTHSINYTQPIKVDKGTSINFVNTFTAGASTSAFIIYGHTATSP